MTTYVMSSGWALLLWGVFMGAAVALAFSWWPARHRGGRWQDIDWSYRNDEYRHAPVFTVPTARFASRNVGRGPRGYRRSDARIEEDINDRLLFDEGVDASDVTVDVHDGHVLLTGAVRDRAERRIVEAIADSVLGVNDVDNRLSIDSLPAPEARAPRAH